ncbi:MarR family winged helix-turn-helix transcriptional regulator [Salininema proteolyticum]|uniref:MarR family winged helix-turn-helix transcriptional regulator n=1 Tax=Salininema proteolyticum TaxID=1607685 RepID=A0ABV8TUQ2_9ACTN
MTDRPAAAYPAGPAAALRELVVTLSLLNHHVSADLGIQPVDLDCLDVINRKGPLQPSRLADLTGLHRATVTGILSRLEKRDLIVREPSPKDRRSVTVSFNLERESEILRKYAALTADVDGILASYGEGQVAAIGSFLERAVATVQRSVSAETDG